MLDREPARDDEDDMALVAPMIGEIVRAVLDQAKLDLAALAHARGCHA